MRKICVHVNHYAENNLRIYEKATNSTSVLKIIIQAKNLLLFSRHISYRVYRMQTITKHCKR